jgi:hypothetical protein
MTMQPHPVASPSFQPRRERPLDLAEFAILLDVDGTILDAEPVPDTYDLTYDRVGSE